MVAGKKLQISVELLIIELGLSNQPFHLNYRSFQFLTTDCMFIALWEKISKFGFQLTLGNVSCSPP